jgi:hypothetical protein
VDAGCSLDDPFRAPLESAQLPCSYMHAPFTPASAPFNHMRLFQCRACRRAWVPSVVLATMELPEGLPTAGRAVLVEARVARRKDARAQGEMECVRLSEELVFLEFALHQQLLLSKRRVALVEVVGLRRELASCGGGRGGGRRPLARCKPLARDGTHEPTARRGQQRRCIVVGIKGRAGLDDDDA